jgi:hypothetical protein
MTGAPVGCGRRRINRLNKPLLKALLATVGLYGFILKVFNLHSESFVLLFKSLIVHGFKGGIQALSAIIHLRSRCQ